MALGTVVSGSVSVDGMDDHGLVVVITEEDHGMWELSDAALASVRAELAAPTPPTTLAALLEATAV